MPISLNISPRLVKSISSLYNDPNRIIMEYIDNSLDSAEEWFDKESKNYKKFIKIILQYQGKNYKDGKVTITDNCFGITNFKKVVQSIGDSDKKAQSWTNGQFGYGIYSFMAACEELEVISKLQDSEAFYIPIARSQFDTANQKDVKFPDPKRVDKFVFQSGTQIALSSFDKDSWKQIDITELKNEIEKHFELLLARKGLEISIIDQTNTKYICESFDYEKYEGEVYEDYITDFHLSRDKRFKRRLTESVADPVHVFLKMTSGVTINKPPVFISKGRRICEIKDVKSFKSNHKSDIWGHPNVTGYVDLHDLLGPTIARNDFKNTHESRALYQTLIDLEEVILEFVKKANLDSEDRHYQQLEDVLNKALSKLARIDAMNYRTDYLKDGSINLGNNSQGTGLDQGLGGRDFGYDAEPQNSNDGIGGNDGEDLGPKEGGEKLPGEADHGNQANNEPQDQNDEFTGQEKRKSGFNIRISDTEPQIDNETSKPKRSLLVGSDIIIFKKHPDFQIRVSHTRQGETKISERLITYLAGEITVHYKDKYYNKINEGQPEYNINMFIGLMEFVYQFENMLASLSGKNLSDL